MDDATQSKLLQAILAPVFQPQAQLGQTQQATQTSGAEQANLQASNPGIQATSQTQQVQAIQNQAKLALGKSLDSGMDLKTALKTYSALGIKPDDVFKQYLSQRGMPDLSPVQLQNMGVSNDVLGQPGQANTYADRWNTRNAIVGLRDLQDKFHKTGAYSAFINNSGLANFGFDKDAANAQAAYEAGKNLFTEHLTSLVPGGSNASGDIAKVTSSIPTTTDMRDYAPGRADTQFSSTEDQLLKMKGYNYSDLGLPEPKTQQQTQQSASQTTKQTSGGDLLNTILQNAGSDITNAAKGGAQTAFDTARNATIGKAADLDPTGTIRGALAKVGVLPEQTQGQQAMGQAVNTLNEYAKASGIVNNNRQIAGSPQEVATNAISHAEEHPVNTALDVLGPILGIKGATMETGAAIPEKPTTTFSGGGNPLMDFVAPGRAINKGGQARDANIQAATSAKITSKGNDIVDTATTKLNNLKMATQDKNDEAAINDAIKTVNKKYSGKNFTPTQLKTFYDAIQDPYTKGGAVRTPIQASIDKITKDSLSTILGKDVPGWNQTTARMAKGFKTQDSGARKFAGRAAAAGLGIAGLDELRKVLGIPL